MRLSRGAQCATAGAQLISPEAVTALLPDAVAEMRQPAPRRPWIIRYGARTAVLRATPLDAIRPLGFSQELALASVHWLHDVLRDLAAIGFLSPEPVDELDGRSIAIVDGVLWELLSFVPGRPMGWSDDEMREAGAELGRLHRAFEALPAREQRPGALTIDACHPSDPVAIDVRAGLERELADIGHGSAPGTIVHGDATQANVVIDGGRYALVDYTIAFQEAPLFDVASALWRNGRVDANSVNYDPARAAIFVSGYHEVHRLTPADARAVVVYMKARGLQLQQRLELRHGSDPTVIARLESVRRQQGELVEAIGRAL